jgi:predicted small lipoprotein YifL
MTRHGSRPLTTVIALLALALCLSGGLSACGKKNALTPPEDSEYPRQYPRQ